MHRSAPTSSRQAQRGVSLIEVMVAVLVMGVGLLGIAAMQATALRNSQSALERSQAVIQTYAIIEAMRANRAAAITNAYNLASMTCAAPAAGATLAQTDLNQWIGSLKTTMSGPANAATDTTSCGRVACVSNLCTVTVQWDDSRGTDVAGGTPSARTVTTSVLL